MNLKATFARSITTLLAFGLAPGALSCATDKEPTAPGDPGGSPAPGSPTNGRSGSEGGSPAGPPAFVVGTRVWDATTTTSYFHVVPSTEAGTTVDPSKAIEVPGAAKLFSIEGVGWFAFGAGEEPTITRYTLGADGRLTPGIKISLQPHGVTGLWDTLYVVSPTKMYYPDRDGQQLIIIDPSAMAVLGTIPLPATARAGYLSLYGYTPLLRDGKLAFSVGWFDWKTNDSVLGETGLVVIDTATDTVARFDVDTRCGGITTGATTASGDTYFVSSALAAAAHRLGRLTTKPCALRVKAGADAFDSTYVTHLDTLTGAPIAGEPVPANGDAIFLRVFDQATGVVTPEDQTWKLTSQTVWQWWRWDVATGTATRVEALAPSTSDVLWFKLNGRVYGTETKADYSDTTLIELTAEGGPKPALTVPGFMYGIAQVR